MVVRNGERSVGSLVGSSEGASDGNSGGTTSTWRSPDGLTYEGVLKRTSDWVREHGHPQHRFGGFRAYPGESAGNNVTKGTVLVALEGGWQIVAQLVVSTGLSVGRVRGCLARCERYGFVRRSGSRVQLVPQGSAFAFALTERGRAWLEWHRGN